MFISLGQNSRGVVYDTLMKEVESEQEAFREIRSLLESAGPITMTTVDVATYDDSCPVFKSVRVGVTKDGITEEWAHFIIRKSSSPMYSVMPKDPSLCKLCTLEVALYTKYMENITPKVTGDIGFAIESR